MKIDIFYNDYESEPIGNGNPYYRCKCCHNSAPEINGKLENHEKWCSYRIEKEKELGLAYLFNELTDLIEKWEGNTNSLIEEERYIEFRNKIKELIKG